MKYVTKPKYVEAYQINDENLLDLISRFYGASFKFDSDNHSVLSMDYALVTYENGSYICIMPNGRVQHYTQEEFESRFDKVDR